MPLKRGGGAQAHQTPRAGFDPFSCCRTYNASVKLRIQDSRLGTLEFLIAALAFVYFAVYEAYLHHTPFLRGARAAPSLPAPSAPLSSNHAGGPPHARCAWRQIALCFSPVSCLASSDPPRSVPAPPRHASRPAVPVRPHCALTRPPGQTAVSTAALANCSAESTAATYTVPSQSAQFEGIFPKVGTSSPSLTISDLRCDSAISIFD